MRLIFKYYRVEKVEKFLKKLLTLGVSGAILNYRKRGNTNEYWLQVV